MGAGGKVLVAAATAAAFGNDQLLVRLLKVMDQFAGILIVKRCTHRHLQGDGAPILTGAIRAHAMLAALRLVFMVISEMNQRVVALARLHHDVAATAAVAARGAAPGHELLAPEGHAAVSAVAGLHTNFGFINEQVVSSQWSEKMPKSIARLNYQLPSLQFSELGSGGPRRPCVLCDGAYISSEKDQHRIACLLPLSCVPRVWSAIELRFDSTAGREHEPTKERTAEIEFTPESAASQVLI